MKGQLGPVSELISTVVKDRTRSKRQTGGYACKFHPSDFDCLHTIVMPVELGTEGASLVHRMHVSVRFGMIRRAPKDRTRSKRQTGGYACSSSTLRISIAYIQS